MSHFRPKQVFKEAKALEASGQVAKASQQYASVALHFIRRRKFQEAKTILKHVLQLSPDSARLQVPLAVCELELGDLVAAGRRVRDFFVVATKKNRLEVYRHYCLAQIKTYPALRQIFYEICLETDRTTASHFLALAEALIEQKKWHEAQKILLNALKTKDRQDESIDMLREVLKQNGSDDGIGYLEAFARSEMTVEDLSLLLSEKRLKPTSNPTPPRSKEEKSLQALIHELEEEIGLEIDVKADAVRPLLREFKEKSRKVLGTDAKALIDMALAYFEMGLIEAAIEELSQVRSTDPLYLEGQCLLGDILISQGSDLGALDVFQSCLRDERAVGEVRREALYQLAQIYFRLSDFDQSLRVISELERLDPYYRDLKELKQQIGVRLGTPPQEKKRLAQSKA